jgi:hypothetical protein
MVHTLQKLKTSNLNLDFEFQQLLRSLKHVINIIMWIRDTGYYIGEVRQDISQRLPGPPPNPLRASAQTCVSDGPEREDGHNATTRGGTPSCSLSTRPRAWEVKSTGGPCPPRAILNRLVTSIRRAATLVSSPAGPITRSHTPKPEVSRCKAPVRILPKPSNYLSNNTRLGNVNGQMADNGLNGQRHHRPKRGEL